VRNSKALARHQAIRRGLEFIYRTACDEANFEDWGHDYLGCFHCIASTSKDADLAQRARELGQERARHWRRKHPAVPPDADANVIADLVFGSVAANHFGIYDSTLKPQIRKAAANFTALDYFWFDPVTEPPPADIPEDCHCGADNPRGRKKCSRCKKPLKMLSRYGVYIDALTRSYFADRLGVVLGARYRDVIKWLPAMRPYRGRENGHNPDFVSSIYAVTHVVYTLNGYSTYKLSPRWLPDEYEFLRSNLVEAIAMEDPETMGEFLDSLKAFGLTENHPLIRKGMDYVLATQNADGSWGDVDAEDIYERYHPTWTAIDGLREYAWGGERLYVPGLMRTVGAMAANRGNQSQ
jgi:hypothetical protein